MNTAEDTLDLTQVPFYQWDSIPYDLEVEAPEVGVATDSTFGVYMLRDTTAVRESVERPSLFAGHELPVNQPLAERAATAPQAWVFVVLVALMAVTTLYYRQSKIRFGEMLRSLFDSRAMDRMMRNNNLTRSSQLAPMGMLLAVTAALPVHQLALARTGFVGYLLLAVGLVLAYYLRNGVIRLLAAIFDDTAATGSYIASNYLYHLVLATVMLPLLLPLLYMPFGRETFTYILAILVVIAFVMRLIRGMKLFLTQSSGSYFYLFYYLCIVEIAPILLMAKWLIV